MRTAGSVFSIRQKNGKLKYFVTLECKCGNFYTSRADHRSKSCGCVRSEKNKTRRKGKVTVTADHVRNLAAKVVYRTYSDGDITFEKFLELSSLDCYYCGTHPSNSSHLGRNQDGTKRMATKVNSAGEKYVTVAYYAQFNDAEFRYNGLDRIDQTLPHYTNNVVTCCRTCNMMKRHFSQDQFISHIEKILCTVNKKHSGN